MQYSGYSEGYHFTESGLDYVLLENGYNIEEDDDLGEVITIHNSYNLHMKLAKAILLYKEKIEGQEIRFFRSLLRLTQRQLADKLGLGYEQIAKWEKDENPIPKLADSFLREVVLGQYIDKNKETSFFEKYKKEQVPYKIIKMVSDNNEWHARLCI